MKSYLLIWILLIALLIGVGYIGFFGFDALPWPSVAILLAGTAVALLVLANEMRRPVAKEYNRKKAMYPRLPDQYLSEKPPTGGVIFGKDHHTGKLVTEENSHVLICGSTGSGKTATCLIPSILSHCNGSAQIVDIKSRELSYKTARIYDENTQIIDLNLQKPWI